MRKVASRRCLCLRVTQPGRIMRRQHDYLPTHHLHGREFIKRSRNYLLYILTFSPRWLSNNIKDERSMDVTISVRVSCKNLDAIIVIFLSSRRAKVRQAQLNDQPTWKNNRRDATHRRNFPRSFLQNRNCTRPKGWLF